MTQKFIKMTPEQEAQLIKEAHENNLMLKNIIAYLNAQVQNKDLKDFSLSVIANIIGNKIDG